MFYISTFVGFHRSGRGLVLIKTLRDHNDRPCIPFNGYKSKLLNALDRTIQSNQPSNTTMYQTWGDSSKKDELNIILISERYCFRCSKINTPSDDDTLSAKNNGFDGRNDNAVPSLGHPSNQNICLLRPFDRTGFHLIFNIFSLHVILLSLGATLWFVFWFSIIDNFCVGQLAPPPPPLTTKIKTININSIYFSFYDPL